MKPHLKSQTSKSGSVTLTAVSNARATSAQNALNLNTSKMYDSAKTFQKYSRTAKLKVKKTSKPIDGFADSYVGFRPPDFRSLHDLTHLRHFVEAHATPDQAISVLHSLETLLKAIPTDHYEESDPSEKYNIIMKLIDAYGFAWNEAVLQLRKISEEHAEVFSKIKTFYLFLVDEYPHILTDYQKQVAKLRKQCEKKDQHIEIIKKEILTFDQKDEETRQFIASLRDEIQRIKNRKTYFKQELNDMTLDNDRLKEELTELRCKIAKANELNQNKILLSQEDGLNESTENFLVKEENGVSLIDTGTDPFELEFNATPAPYIRGYRSSLFVNHEVYDDDLVEIGKKIEPNSALRHVIYSFMVHEPVQPTKKMKIDPNAEMKKFFWIFPKILSLFISGVQFEDSKHPFNTFEELLLCFLTHHYQTSYLTQQMYSSLVQSAQLLDAVNPAIHLFNMFAKCEFDFYQFRFFHTILEFSLCYTSPEISTLVQKEGITADQSHIIISRAKAREVFTACFPFKETPNVLNDGPNNLDTPYWQFLELLIHEFDRCRTHFWAVLKNALLLSDCPDSNHITLSQFCNFMGLVFPRVPLQIVKNNWKALLVRDAASQNDELEKKRYEMLEFSSLTYICTSKDDNINNVMKISTAKNFVARYYEMNAPMLEVISFIVSRMTYCIPNLSSNIPEIQADINELTLKIREALFMCNISNAVSIYRLLLHKLDLLQVRDFTTIIVNNESTIQETSALIEHLKLREKVTGIERGK
ncbi:hypothetical protein TRFO_21705 [Tritrichomonas foetus]|uniref:Uncharacterized protein n=1 Tax=Tritrichomonas foetus TaxID=1144522 RepID=A0A1J4KD77_9EUKA|nr:hypothetical protein TRFO_21705 [Tritrichomonas foetus]|eukprot:OHT09385.1 hypothetical protein TRFO_21705 [Tritrichomonas foetus]